MVVACMDVSPWLLMLWLVAHSCKLEMLPDQERICSRVKRYWYFIHGTVLLLQYCGITKLLRYEQIVLKHHFATYFDTKLQIKLMVYILLLVATVSHSYYTSLNVHLGTQKSIYVEKNTYISTSRYNGIQKIRRYQKPILRYNYTTGILLNTTQLISKIFVTCV